MPWVRKGYSKYFYRLNKRRLALIDKKFSVGLDAREERVLEWLQGHLSSFEPPMDFRLLELETYILKTMCKGLYPRGTDYPKGHKRLEKEAEND